MFEDSRELNPGALIHVIVEVLGPIYHSDSSTAAANVAGTSQLFFSINSSRYCFPDQVPLKLRSCSLPEESILVQLLIGVAIPPLKPPRLRLTFI